MIFAIAWTMEVWGSKGLPVNMGDAVRTSEQTTARKIRKTFSILTVKTTRDQATFRKNSRK